MIGKTSKNANRHLVHSRIRKKILGTAERPRLNVYRSLNHIYAQVIDDLQGITLVAANSVEDRKGVKRAGGTWLRPKRWGRPLPNVPKPRELPRLCLIAAVTSFTAGSRH